jgi:hypothetical protein
MGTPKGTYFSGGRPSPSDVEGPGPSWIAIATLLPAAAGLVAKMRAIDLAYHVRLGEITLRTGDVVRTDPLTFTRGGLPWLNQQWGAQVIFAIAHRLMGWVGVAITHAASIGSGFLFVYRSCLYTGAHPRASAVLTVLGFLVGGGAIGARPQSLAIPLFTGTWLLLARRTRWVWLVPVLSVVWANVHGSFVLAPVLTAFALADDLVAKKPVQRGLLVFLATVTGTFISPFGPSVWSYAAEITSNETIRNSVTEWRPPLPWTVGGGPFWLSGVAVALVGLKNRRRVRPVDFARLLVFFALGVPAFRGTLWWALVAPPIVASWCSPSERTGPEGAGRRPASTRAAAVILLLGLLPVLLLLRGGIDPETGSPARLAADAPQVLVDETRRHLPSGSRLFVFQPFASWFEFSLPLDPVMVDSRIELFPSRVWRDYDVVIEARDGWERILERYRIRAVVLPPGATLTGELSGADGWRRVADGPAGSVFVRA